MRDAWSVLRRVCGVLRLSSFVLRLIALRSRQRNSNPTTPWRRRCRSRRYFGSKILRRWGRGPGARSTTFRTHAGRFRIRPVFAGRTCHVVDTLQPGGQLGAIRADVAAPVALCAVVGVGLRRGRQVRRPGERRQSLCDPLLIDQFQDLSLPSAGLRCSDLLDRRRRFGRGRGGGCVDRCWLR